MANVQFEEFLDLTYRVVDAEENWYDLLAELAKAAQADNAAIVLQDLKSGDSRGYLWGIEEKAQRAYFSYYGALNPWMPGSDVKPPDGFIAGEAFLPLSKVLRTKFYTDWGRANDVVHTAGATLQLRSVKFLYLAFSRKQVHGGFSDASLQPIQRILLSRPPKRTSG